MLIYLSLLSALSTSQTIILHPFIRECMPVARALRLWDVNLRKLSSHLLHSAHCPSYAHGIGSLVYTSHAASDARLLFEGTTMPAQGCYDPAIFPLCLTNVSTNYVPQPNCETAIFPMFRTIVSGCIADSPHTS